MQSYITNLALSFWRKPRSSVLTLSFNFVHIPRRKSGCFGAGKSSVLRSLCGSFLSREDAHLPAFGQKHQCPLRHDKQPVREPDQEIDVHDRPDNPCRKSGEAEHAKIGERVGTPRDREIAFVPIPEGPRRPLSCRASSNQGCHVPSFLNGWLRHAWHDHRLFGLDPQQIPRRRKDRKSVV